MRLFQDDTVRLLVHECGADPNVADSDGETPLHVACAEVYVPDGKILSVYGCMRFSTFPLQHFDHSFSHPLFPASRCYKASS